MLGHSTPRESPELSPAGSRAPPRPFEGTTCRAADTAPRLMGFLVLALVVGAVVLFFVFKTKSPRE